MLCAKSLNFKSLFLICRKFHLVHFQGELTQINLQTGTTTL